MSSRRRLRYVRVSTIFSPEGRIFQVEYALELVRRGAPVVGVKSPEGCVLAGVEIEHSPLASEAVSRKIFKLDEHVEAAIAGLSPDARVLIRRARLLCQGNRLTYEEPIDVETLTGDIGELYQVYTQRAYIRPFGVSMIICGVDFTGPCLASVGPSGSYRLYKAHAIGRNEEQAKNRLKKLYREGLSLDEAQAFAVDALKAALEEDLEPGQITLAIITIETGEIRELTSKEVAKYF